MGIFDRSKSISTGDGPYSEYFRQGIRRLREEGEEPLEKYVLVQRNKLPIVNETSSVNILVTKLTMINVIPVEGCIVYLSYGTSTTEIIDGMVVPNRAILEFGKMSSKAGITGVIWNDEFIVVKRLPTGFTGLTDEEIIAAKRTFGKSSIAQAHSLGFLP